MLDAKIQKFLSTKISELKKDNLKKDELKKNKKFRMIDFADQIGISYQTILSILSHRKVLPSFYTITRIANHFNCAIDEVLGRNTSFTDGTKFNPIDADKVNEKLRIYIRQAVKDRDLNPYKLGANIGFNQLAITQFIKEGSTQKSLGSNIVVALANYLNVSLDEMTGRVSANQVKYVEVEGEDQDKIPEVNEKLNSLPNLQELAKDIKDIKKDIKDMKTVLQCFLDKENNNKENE